MAVSWASVKIWELGATKGCPTGERVFSCVKCLNGKIETFIEGKGFEHPCGQFPARGLFESPGFGSVLGHSSTCDPTCGVGCGDVRRWSERSCPLEATLLLRDRINFPRPLEITSKSVHNKLPNQREPYPSSWCGMQKSKKTPAFYLGRNRNSRDFGNVIIGK